MRQQQHVMSSDVRSGYLWNFRCYIGRDQNKVDPTWETISKANLPFQAFHLIQSITDLWADPVIHVMIHAIHPWHRCLPPPFQPLGLDSSVHLCLAVCLSSPKPGLHPSPCPSARPWSVADPVVLKATMVVNEAPSAHRTDLSQQNLPMPKKICPREGSGLLRDT